MKLERKYMAHYLNAHFAKDSEGEASYVRLGADLEEYSPDRGTSLPWGQRRRWRTATASRSICRWWSASCCWRG